MNDIGKFAIIGRMQLSIKYCRAAVRCICISLLQTSRISIADTLPEQYVSVRWGGRLAGVGAVS